MKNRITKVLALLLIAAGLIATSGCDGNVPEKNYTVSFYMNGHGSQIESQTVKEGENAVRPADPAEEGQVFGGWFTDSECSAEFDFGTAIKSDIQLFAKWTAKGPASYTVTFDANGGSGSMDAQVFTEGVAGVLKSCTFTAPEHKVFAGWAESADGEVKYADGASYTASADVTLFAKWIEIPATTYTVTFDANGGSGSMDAQVFTEGVAGVLKSCTFTAPEHKVFAGWAESADGAVEYADGASYTASADVTLFAKWINNYLCFTAGAGGAKVSMAKNGDGWTLPEVQYSTDGVTWSDFTIGTTRVTLNAGDKVYFKGNNPNGFNKSNSNYVKFVLSGSAAASGNVMSLVDTDCKTTTIPNNYCFTYLFYNCTSLTAAPELPATTLAERCYFNMFERCTSLTAAPALPATTLAVSCYEQMFYGCTSLTTAPELKATTLAPGCYEEMFCDCTTLTAAPELKATTLADYCYYGMFSGCTTLTAAPALPATTLAVACYSDMFYDCESLTTASELKATTLAECCYSDMFSGCTSLTTASELKATTLAPGCYASMFYGCTSLRAAPELKATTLAPGCYNSMFAGCESLTAAPELPATTLADMCYYSMFSGCRSLTAAPELKATTLADYCYSNMFFGCTTLTAAPELPAGTLADYCYAYMFYGCRSLMAAPALPATTLAESCYERMFSSCTSLTTAPELKATSLAKGCYDSMFCDCTKLSSLNVSFTAWNGDATSDWLKNAGKDVSGIKTFTCPEFLDTSTRDDSHVPAGWTIVKPCTVTFDANGGSGTMDSQAFTYGVAGKLNSCSFTAPEGKVFAGWAESGDGVVKYADGASYTASANVTLFAKWTTLLCFTAGTGGATVSMAKQGSSWTLPEVQYSTDGVTWSDFTIGTTSVTLNEGDKVYFKGNNPNGFNNSISNYLRFVLAGSAASSGNVMSLVDPDCKTTTIPNNYCFVYLFSGCTTLTAAPELKATTLADYCYYSMFSGCTTLTAAPELPATTLAQSCYNSMFSGCTTLTAAPALPAGTLAVQCYNNMFYACTSLTTAPALPATTLAVSCYYCMFSGCTSLRAAPELKATTLAQSCYSGMFFGCESLTVAPALPATSLAVSCYCDMFNGCTSLTAAPALPATYLGYMCYHSMFSDCTSLTAAPALPATYLGDKCYMSMFSGCTSLRAAPALPATTLALECYSSMFYGCTKLSSLNVSFTAWNALTTDEWLKNAGTDASETKTFTCPASLDISTRDKDHIPSGWTIITK